MRHSIPLALNARLFCCNFRRTVVRTDKKYVDVEDLLNLLFAPEQARKQLTAWKHQCSAGKLKKAIKQHANVFSDRVKPSDISTLKWIHSEDTSPRLGRSRVVCTATGACVILSLLTTSRDREDIDSAIRYFSSISLNNYLLDVVFDDLAQRERTLSKQLRTMTQLPMKPLINWELSDDVLQQTACTGVGIGEGVEGVEGVERVEGVKGYEDDDAASLTSTQVSF